MLRTDRLRTFRDFIRSHNIKEFLLSDWGLTQEKEAKIVMRVLLINHFPLEGSGSGTYSGNIARYLIKNGHEVCLIFPENAIPEEIAGAKSSLVYFNKEGQNSSALPYNFPCFTTHPRSNTTFADLDQNELAQYLAAFDQVIAERIAAFRPDIVHVQHIWLLAYLVSKYQIPFVITTHGTDLIGYEKWPEFRRFCDIAANNCARIIAISRDNHQSVLKIFPRAKNKTLLMPNGYNSDIFYLEETDRAALLAEYGISYDKELIILFAGKLTAVKGLDTLLLAAREYEKSQPGNIITVIAGTGEKKEELWQLKEELKLNSVYFIGHRNQNELRLLYSNADIFVMPSRYEAFGLVALEAMACGLAVVASNVGGLPDFIGSEVGTLVQPDDPKALCNAIIQEISQTQKNKERKSEIAQYAFKHYSQEKFTSKLEEVYRQCLIT